MSNRTLNLTDALYDYVLAHSLREHPAQTALRNATRDHERASMQISPEQGQFMALLVKLMGARNAIEVGVFTGYSAMSVALALPPEGRLVACDISEEYTSVAQPYWREAGVADKIDLRIAPALETLQTLLRDGEAGLYDFAFIDADKVGYDGYYEACLQLVRRGGLIVFDNTLRDGKVLERADSDDTAALQALNIKLREDQRIDLSMLPISDGVTLARKR
ncbi:MULTISPECIES: class I SAM-dependent methyltransferase [unclassified Duganella]|uniref:class I SAM-dependent methyltransferase n=1 Tax=unclassified Duganella TaxID=2636909 RepID=UPI000882127F|nr:MULTISPECIES: class I SAM-dependent methyltransferase [unclassified Duganella]SDF66705.1 Predicted O-methyltransferase YrrM [Duganella sp. OV458]SDI62297.1 Predicted O-methyltransferase YrrM [Duganella sp. OV510]